MESWRHHRFIRSLWNICCGSVCATILCAFHHPRGTSVPTRPYSQGLDVDFAEHRDCHGCRQHLCPTLLHPDLLPIRSRRLCHPRSSTIASLHHLPGGDEPGIGRVPFENQVLLINVRQFENLKCTRHRARLVTLVSIVWAIC